MRRARIAHRTVVHDITPWGSGGAHRRQKNRSQRTQGEKGVRQQLAPRCAAGIGLPFRNLKGSKALVVAFIASDCPISNLYLPELIDLEKKYRSQGVQFVGVYPNDADDLDRIASHAYDRFPPFLVLKDNSQKHRG